MKVTVERTMNQLLLGTAAITLINKRSGLLYRSFSRVHPLLMSHKKGHKRSLEVISNGTHITNNFVPLIH
jgi:hypothetical protein